MKTLKILFIALMAAVLAGCCYCQKYARLYGRPLEKTNWELIQVDGRQPQTDYVLILSKSGELTLTAPNSQVTGKYRANNDGVMVIDNLAQNGIPADAELQGHIVEMLPKTTNYKMDGLFLMMIRNGEVWAMFETKDPKAPKPKKVWDEALQEYVTIEE